MQIDVSTAAKILSESGNIVIFAHRKPDGDTIGSSFALMYALEKMGKKARIECSDPLLHGRFNNIFGEYTPAEFEADFLVAVDIADPSLLNGVENAYGKKIDLCVDHHVSNSLYATHTLLDPSAAATAEIVQALIVELGVKPDKKIADAVFTGLSTDTGCFKFANTTSRSHIVAAWAMEHGADSAYINKLMFDTKSRGRLEVDRLILDSISYYFDGRCALIYIPRDVPEKYSVSEEELDGISAFPRTVEGVLAGITIRERENNSFRISLRTEPPLNASRICGSLGGGGHVNAAGCTLEGSFEEVKDTMLGVVLSNIKEAL